MELRLFDVVRTKKKHPCGSDLWEITRIGMDIKLVCRGCGHEIMLPRARAEATIKEIVKE